MRSASLIALKVEYRGSLIPVWMARTAGVSTSTTSTSPPSSSRWTTALRAAWSYSTFFTTATRGRSRNSASAAPVDPWTESLDWTPTSTRSGCSGAIASAERGPIAIGSWIGSVDRDPDRPVGAHGEASLERHLGGLVADRDDHDLALPAEPFADPQRLLGGAGVPLVQCPVLVVLVHVRLVRGELGSRRPSTATCFTQTTIFTGVPAG